ncbi:hypothetical protein BD310DRAFT_939382 [Dichomitus squalens]|uniref:Uncharacterized protein n=1 Tax=Dichomitus squalens TaxID=114155 RepID=A0A4Q9PDQ1_9APHY|nr:hypothetical protein BD310DRAFT_939382 [Dichomitus squalens]
MCPQAVLVHISAATLPWCFVLPFNSSVMAFRLLQDSLSRTQCPSPSALVEQASDNIQPSPSPLRVPCSDLLIQNPCPAHQRSHTSTACVHARAIASTPQSPMWRRLGNKIGKWSASWCADMADIVSMSRNRMPPITQIVEQRSGTKLNMCS